MYVRLIIFCKYFLITLHEVVVVKFFLLSSSYIIQMNCFSLGWC